MRIGVLGMGSIGARHIRNLEELGHVVARHDPVLASSPREAVIDWAEAIVVASPSKNHSKDLMDAIKAEKHVLVEKPFGYDCPPLLAGFMQATRHKKPNLIVATGFNLRFHHSVRTVKKVLNDGTLGKLICASFTVNQRTTKPPYLMDGIIRNWMSHEIDLAHHLLGNGTVTSCIAPADSEGRDISECWITMDFPAVEQSVYLQGDYYSDPEQRYFWIEGEKGSVYCNLVRREVYLRMRGEDPKPYHLANDTWDRNYLDEMSTFIHSIQTAKCHMAPLATGEDGVRCLYSVMQAREKAGLHE